MKIPRIPEGKGFLGPDYFGCCSGMRPAIFHSKNGKWIIGPELYAREVLQKCGHFTNKRIHKFNMQIVWISKSRSSAIKHFKLLCAEIETWNTQQRIDYDNAKTAALGVL